MGSYSMFCGLSGLEIAERKPAVVTILTKSSFDGWNMIVPPIRGKYDDYGSLQVDEADSELAKVFGLKLEDYGDWQPLEFDGVVDEDANEYAIKAENTLPYWIDGAIYDCLGDLTRDYSHYKRNGTINDDLAHMMMEKEATLAKIIKEKEEDKGFDYTEEEAKQEGCKRFEFWTMSLYSLFPSSAEDVLKEINGRMKHAIRHDQSPYLVLEGYRRASLLYMGSMELRKPLIGQNGSYGPQHGGEKALLAFYEAATKELRARVEEAKQYENEDEE